MSHYDEYRNGNPEDMKKQYRNSVEWTTLTADRVDGLNPLVDNKEYLSNQLKSKIVSNNTLYNKDVRELLACIKDMIEDGII